VYETESTKVCESEWSILQMLLQASSINPKERAPWRPSISLDISYYDIN
jgi:hypothetical protein